MTHNCTVSECTSLTVCVGEWSRRPRYSSTIICGRQCASTLVIRQWRSRVGRWPRQSSHSTAEQSTRTKTRPRRHKLSSQAVVARTIMLQRTHITTLRSTQQWAVVDGVWHHLAVSSTLTHRLITQSSQRRSTIMWVLKYMTTTLCFCVHVFQKQLNTLLYMYKVPFCVSSYIFSK